MPSAAESAVRAVPTPAANAIGSSAADIEAINTAFARLKEAYRKDPQPSYEQRLQWLDKLLRAVRDNRKQISEAINEDFRNRSFHETQIAEVFTLIMALRDMKKKLKRWMKPEARSVALPMKPATAKVHYQPLGVVGIISPWNYPVSLAIGPLAAALAAGNRALIKPSEYTPRTSALLQRMLDEALGPDVVAVITGSAEVGAAFSRVPFDHLLFTGSTAVGRHVMRAAAENLTPVTLELGGKSPAIVHDSYPLERAAGRIAAGKCFNAGQTCIAPDYLLVPKEKLEATIEALKQSISQSYPTLRNNGDYTAVVNDKHRERLLGLVADARARGARVIEINPANEQLDAADGKIAPTLIVGVDDGMRVMQEEIFGPVLPIMAYDSLEQALQYVNDHPRPLALYYFDNDKARVREVLDKTVAGGVTINDTLLHFAAEDLPFGGVGPSGMGAYHGYDGFVTFSHKKAVLYQAKFNGSAQMNPPYQPRLDKLLDFLIGK
jgi:coniferyl-aldehyde dehydrogenase